MLVRICLIVAILAGLGAFYFAHLEVDKKFKTVITQRDDTRKELADTKAVLETTKTELANTKMTLETTSNELATTKTQLADTASKLATTEDSLKRANDSITSLNKTKNSLQTELSAWAGLRKTPDEMKQIIKDLDATKQQVVAANGEKDIIKRELDKVAKQLRDLIGDGDAPPPPLPAGLKGKIVSVDPKFNFVVLDIGGNQGVVESGEMLINRKGKLIGKVKIRTVEANRCVANVMPSWKQGEPFEGDEVLY